LVIRFLPCLSKYIKVKTITPQRINELWKKIIDSVKLKKSSETKVSNVLINKIFYIFGNRKEI